MVFLTGRKVDSNTQVFAGPMHNFWHNHRMHLHLCVLLFVTVSLSAQNFTVQKSNSTENLRGVRTLSSQVAWASGTHGTYLRTTNGGNSWQAAQVLGAESLDFRDVEAFSADLAYLLSAGPGDQSRIYKTTDAGKNWKPLLPDTLPPAVEGEGAFAASGTCITVQGNSNVWFATGGKAARVFRSTNAGKTWTVADTPMIHGPDSAGIFSIAFRDAAHGVIAGGDYKHPQLDGPNLAFTNDGGLTWKLSALSPQTYFSAVAFAQPDSGGTAVLAAGSARAAYADDITKKSWQKTWDLNLNALSISPTGEAIAVGPKGLIVHFGAVLK
jgi:photosystem II stability/assembly factor-like uncharacterized protein